MAEETSDQSQKTEQPTQKRLDEARAKGNVARFAETRHAAMFAGAAVATATTVALMAEEATSLLTLLLGDADDVALSPTTAQAFAGGLMSAVAKLTLPTLLLLFVIAIAGGLASGRPTIAWERLRPKWSKLSPVAGFKRLFGMQGLVEFLKTLAKFGIVAGAFAYVVMPEQHRIEALVGGDAAMLATHVESIVLRLLIMVAAVVAALAILDILYQRMAFQKKMMMSRQEVREEHRQTEGSPEVRARIRELRQAKARQRMMAAVPTASVVIMNPTHYAVALRYAHGVDAVPTCVAKGIDAVALRIRDVAREHGVAVVENPPLARALHASVDIDEPVPFEHYAAVAEVIGYVMRLGTGARPRA